MKNEIKKFTEIELLKLRSDLIDELETKLWKDLQKLDFDGIERSEIVTKVVNAFISQKGGIEFFLSANGRVTASKDFFGVMVSVTLMNNMRFILMNAAISMGVPVPIAGHHLFVEDLFHQFEYSVKYL